MYCECSLHTCCSYCMHAYCTYVLLVCGIRVWYACHTHVTRVHNVCDAFVSHLCFQIQHTCYIHVARVLLALCTYDALAIVTMETQDIVYPI